MKFLVTLATAILISSPISAKTLTCDTQLELFTDWFGLELVQFDPDKNKIRFGSQTKWLSWQTMQSKNIAIGIKYVWQQTLTATTERESGKKYQIDFSLRQKANGKIDLWGRGSSSGINLEMPLKCK